MPKVLDYLAPRSSAKRKFWLAGYPDMSQPLGAARAEHPGTPFLRCLTPTWFPATHPLGRRVLGRGHFRLVLAVGTGPARLH